MHTRGFWGGHRACLDGVCNFISHLDVCRFSMAKPYFHYTTLAGLQGFGTTDAKMFSCLSMRHYSMLTTSLWIKHLISVPPLKTSFPPSLCGLPSLYLSLYTSQLPSFTFSLFSTHPTCITLRNMNLYALFEWRLNLNIYFRIFSKSDILLFVCLLSTLIKQPTLSALVTFFFSPDEAV